MKVGRFTTLGVIVMLFIAADSTWAAEIIAHRGASYDAPENTLAAVNLAWERNADAVEIDVHLSKDGQIVVIHDKTTTRTAGKAGDVAKQTLAELKALDVGRWKGKQYAGERIPTLDEVLATIPDGKRLFIEIKCGPEIVPALKKSLQRAGKEPDQTAVISFSWETVTAVKRELPRLQTYWIVKLRQDAKTGQWTPTVDHLIQKTQAANLDGLDLSSCEAIDQPFVDRVTEAGLGLYVWTVNSAHEAQRVDSLGIEGITTDRPGWLRTQLVPAAVAP